MIKNEAGYLVLNIEDEYENDDEDEEGGESQPNLVLVLVNIICRSLLLSRGL
jgi:hypothetical protein